MSRPAAKGSVELSTAVEGCLEACRRCEALVDRIANQDSSVASRAYEAIGPHLRHCLDHYQCFLGGLAGGVVDYDARERSALLERDPRAFRRALASVVERLEQLGGGHTERGLRVRQAAAPHGKTVVVESNLERELVFLSGHTIHHLAIMKMLAEARGVLVSEPLDIAFSTQAHLGKAE